MSCNAINYIFCVYKVPNNELSRGSTPLWSSLAIVMMKGNLHNTMITGKKHVEVSGLAD